MFQELGTAAGLLILMLYLSVFIDAFVIFNIMVKKAVGANEYAAAALKPAKIAILLLSAGVMFFFAILYDFSITVKIIMAILGTLLAADGIISILIKKKYGRKK